MEQFSAQPFNTQTEADTRGITEKEIQFKLADSLGVTNGEELISFLENHGDAIRKLFDEDGTLVARFKVSPTEVLEEMKNRLTH